MRKAFARALCALVCFALLFSSAIPAFAEGIEIGTTVSIMVESFEIETQTEDCTLNEGDELTLTVGVSGAVSNYKWELSTDGGTEWTQVGTNATYDITDAKPNSPADVAYQYRVTVTNSIGQTASAIIRVLVSNEYGYRTIELRGGDTEVTSYMHEETRLVVTPLSDSAAATELESKLTDGCLPLVLYDVSLVNQNNEVVPYFGRLKIDFHVGSEYDGDELRVFHYKDGKTEIYTGVVSEGILSIIVDELSPFMVEVPATDTHAITVNVGTGGSVTPSGTVNVADGSDKTFTLLPNAGYEVDEVTVGGVTQEIIGNSFTLTNIEDNKAVSVSFRQVTPSETMHTVEINAPARGSVHPSGEIKVLHGSAQTIYFNPENGYELYTVTVNGATVSVIGSSYTLSAVTGDTTVVVSFTEGTSQPPDVFKKIEASAGANGSISPMGPVSVEYGGDMYFYFIPDDGYEVDKVIINDTETAVSGGFYHFINVVADQTINVTFKESSAPPPAPTYHNITATSGVNGSISPGSTQVPQGGAQTFSFIPNTNYRVDAVYIDGVEINVSGSTYTFTDVAADHTIHVTFERIVTPTPTPRPRHRPASESAPTPGSPVPTPAPVRVTAPTPVPVPTAYYTIAASSGENGAISPEGDVLIAHGGSAYFYFLPDEGFEVDAVTVDGETIAAEEGSYCFEDVDGEHSIHVTFKEVASAPDKAAYHTITVSAEGGGSISPSGEVQVPDGGSQTFYLIADDGHEVEAIYVNGEKQDVVGGQFTVDSVTGDLELRVSFKPRSVPDLGDASHCFICGWAGRNISPWCWLTPVSVVVALVIALRLFLSKRQK